MFTGIISDIGIVKAINVAQSLITVYISRLDINLGESVAINGVCLTVADIKEKYNYCFQVSLETLNCTNLGNLAVGSECNIELAMPANGRFGGHLVSGHVDTIATVIGCDSKGEYLELNIQTKLPGLWIKKGSIALNGVSLTLNYVDENTAKLMLIPHTLAHTNLKKIKLNDIINVEFDMVYKIIAQQYRTNYDK